MTGIAGTRSDRLHLFTATLGAGTLATFVGYPLDVLRTRLICENDFGSIFTLKRGIPFAVRLSIAKTGCSWPLQELLEGDLEKKRLSRFEIALLSGGISNVLPNVFFAPLNVLKVHLMTDQTEQSYLTMFKNIYRKSGLRGYYAGMTATMFRDSIWGGLYFTSVNTLKERIERFDPKMSQISVGFLTSLFSATIATTFTSWIDAVRLLQMRVDREKIGSVGELFKMAMAPTRNNIAATAFGIGRVVISTTVSHTTYQLLEGRD